MAVSDGLAHKIVNHDLRHLIIDDDAVAQRMYDAHIAGRPADQFLRAVADGNDVL